jgi:hypothetical protein
MPIRQNHVASVLFACSVFVFLGIWWVFLFVARPERVTLKQHLSSLLSFTFAESGLHWYFVFLAAMPVVFALLSVAAWRAPPGSWRLFSPLAFVAFVSTAAVALLMSWEVAVFAAAASYFAISNRDG